MHYRRSFRQPVSSRSTATVFPIGNVSHISYYEARPNDLTSTNRRERVSPFGANWTKLCTIRTFWVIQCMVINPRDGAVHYWGNWGIVDQSDRLICRKKWECSTSLEQISWLRFHHLTAHVTTPRCRSEFLSNCCEVSFNGMSSSSYPSKNWNRYKSSNSHFCNLANMGNWSSKHITIYFACSIKKVLQLLY